jgi:hypothetical protein
MPTYSNPSLATLTPIPSTVGPAIHDRRVFDLAAAAGYRPPSLVNTDDIVLFTVPAGCVLIPHLTRIAFPVIDSNGTPTGQASIGHVVQDAAAVPASLRAAQSVGTAVRVDSGEDFLQPNVPIGHPTLPTNVILRLTANVATLAASGQIVSDYFVRAYRSDIDG